LRVCLQADEAIPMLVVLRGLLRHYIPRKRRSNFSHDIIPITKTPRVCGVFLICSLNYFTASFIACPGLNLGTLLAGIVIFLPVAGLTPCLFFSN